MVVLICAVFCHLCMQNEALILRVAGPTTICVEFSKINNRTFFFSPKVFFTSGVSKTIATKSE